MAPCLSTFASRPVCLPVRPLAFPLPLISPFLYSTSLRHITQSIPRSVPLDLCSICAWLVLSVPGPFFLKLLEPAASALLRHRLRSYRRALAPFPSLAFP
eukprot:3521606-Pleurochrysis_carterae.AAC.2